jgi:NarL family two-component system response regulator LiaR
MTTQMHKIRVILVDDHDTIHSEIGGLLAALEEIELVGQGRNGQEAVSLCDQHATDIILMDIAMPVMNGIDATKEIVARHPEIKIIALSGMGDTQTVQQMIAAGAIGYLLKNARPEELVSTIQAVYNGQWVFSSDVVKPLLDNRKPPAGKSPRDYGLTRREMDILQAMSEGLNNNEVAQKLYISTATVRFHVTNIIEKLGVENRMEALVIAIRDRLV